MKLIINIIIIFLISITLNAREIGETEITTEDGIEVFQNEKYYLLKQNVKIVSDNFTLKADEVKINFEKNLYDITELDANGNVDFKSNEFETSGSGKYLNFKVKVEKIRQRNISINKEEELNNMIKFETNKQLNQFSKIFFDKSKINYSINEK